MCLNHLETFAIFWYILCFEDKITTVWHQRNAIIDCMTAVGNPLIDPKQLYINIWPLEHTGEQL
jgi:hypothetical protein